MMFYILTKPRSGSHMLASALDSHPDIQCHGEAVYMPRMESAKWLGKNPGRVEGWIAQYDMFGPKSVPRLNINTPDKIIILTRDHTRRIPHKVTHAHYVIPSIEQYEPDCSYAPVDYSPLFELAKHKPTLVLSYDDMTGNKDIRKLPQEYSDMVCDFLEVERAELTTRFYKPRVVNMGIEYGVQ